jgi:hypothetical protein
LNKDGLGLKEILQLKGRITSLYSNKAMNNHSVVLFFFIILSIIKKIKKKLGTEKLDQKR